MKKVSVVLPCYNEQESLPLYFASVDPVLAKIKDYVFDFVLVNDGSKDKTLEVMKELHETRNDITVVNESRNYGQNAAFTAGLMTAKGDYVIMMDADLQDPVELLIAICEKFSEGYDVVNPHRASRETDSYFKRTTAGMFYRFINRLEGQKVIPENVNCFRGLSRKAVDALLSYPEKDRYYVSMVPLIGLKNCNIDFVRQKREAGESKYNISKMFTYAFNLISTTTAKPLYFPIKFGAISSGFTFLGFLTSLILWILSLTGVLPRIELYTRISLILFSVFFACSLVIFFIGIVCLYLHNILINTRGRPTTTIDEVLEKRRD